MINTSKMFLTLVRNHKFCVPIFYFIHQGTDFCELDVVVRSDLENQVIYFWDGNSLCRNPECCAIPPWRLLILRVHPAGKLPLGENGTLSCSSEQNGAENENFMGIFTRWHKGLLRIKSNLCGIRLPINGMFWTMAIRTPPMGMILPQLIFFT